MTAVALHSLTHIMPQEVTTFTYSNNGIITSKQIATALELLETDVIEERFFKPFSYRDNDGKRIRRNHCPINLLENGFTRFFFNFEQTSYVLLLHTNDPELIAQLSAAISANKGWIDYYEKNLI